MCLQKLYSVYKQHICDDKKIFDNKNENSITILNLFVDVLRVKGKRYFLVFFTQSVIFISSW